jgi:hypothetical protein
MKCVLLKERWIAMCPLHAISTKRPVTVIVISHDGMP